MSSADLDAKMGQRKNAPIWAVALAGTLLAASFGRRRADKAAARTHDETSRVADSTALDDGRGRAADAPSEIPARGWKDILLRVYRGISEDRILLIAAGVTFYLLLSIFPGLAALFSIYGLFAEPKYRASPRHLGRHCPGRGHRYSSGCDDPARRKGGDQPGRRVHRRAGCFLVDWPIRHQRNF